MPPTDARVRARSGLIVAPMTAGHADEVLAIHQEGLDAGDASFETVAPDWRTWDARHLPHHRLVATTRAAGRVLGWVAVSRVSERRVYAGVVESHIYVRAEARGEGVSSALLQALVQSTEETGLWTIQTSVFPEDTENVALHRAHGFRIVGLRERIGRQGDRWRDVLVLERRSPTID